MKPFDLQAAISGAKVVTRDGRPVKIAGYNEDLNSVVGWVDSSVFCWTGGGSGQVNQLDLFMAPTERKEYIVRCYYDLQKTDPYVAGPFKTLFEAQRLADCRVLGLATIHEITIHE